jgi:hypothetical protein
VTPAPGQRHLIRIFLQVKAIGVQSVIDLGPFTIDLS